MKILNVLQELLPIGTNGNFLTEKPTVAALKQPGGPGMRKQNYSLCPVWPPDLFAVIGTIIDRTGCYTLASPDRENLPAHDVYLQEITDIASSWDDLLEVPNEVQELWTVLVGKYRNMELKEVSNTPLLVGILLKLFAICDEVCVGMGWDLRVENAKEFNVLVLANALLGIFLKDRFKLPHWPISTCALVPPDAAIVLPKSVTTTKGCTIRSLSHHLALLPGQTIVKPSWLLTSEVRRRVKQSKLNLLLIPFPYKIPEGSFELSSPRTIMRNKTTHAAFFRLRPRWLEKGDGEMVHGAELGKVLVRPLLRQAIQQNGGKAPDGIVLPECALTPKVAHELAASLKRSGIKFLITGVIEHNAQTGKTYNKARTYAFVKDEEALTNEQNKHHRWRIDRAQANSYGLDFDPDKTNSQWWEDIDVSNRKLPFYAFRRDMSMVTLICEDLARMEPAMDVIRSVGPNLVVALLMDGPQLGARWPGRYAGVLSDEPGCGVLSLTCAATVDKSNQAFKKNSVSKVNRTVALWSQADGAKHELALKRGHQAILLSLDSIPKYQTTLDNRTDSGSSIELKYAAHLSIKVE